MKNFIKLPETSELRSLSFPSSAFLSLSFHLTSLQRQHTMGKEVADDAMDVENAKPGDDKKASSKTKASSASKTPPPPLSILELLLQGAAALDKAAATRDVRALPARALRLAAAARARVVTGADVLAFSREVLVGSSSSEALAEIVSALQQVREKEEVFLKPREASREKRGSSVD